MKKLLVGILLLIIVGVGWWYVQSSRSPSFMIERHEEGVSGRSSVNRTKRVTSTEIIELNRDGQEQKKTPLSSAERTLFNALLNNPAFVLLPIQETYQCKNGATIFDVPKIRLTIRYNSQEKILTSTCLFGALTDAPEILMQLDTILRKL